MAGGQSDRNDSEDGYDRERDDAEREDDFDEAEGSSESAILHWVEVARPVRCAI